MVSKGMKERGTSVRQLAKQLGVTEGALRYRLRVERDGGDGRANQATALDRYAAAVVAIQERLEDGRLTGEGRPCQVRQIYEALVPGSRVQGQLQGGSSASGACVRNAEGSGTATCRDADGRPGAARLVRHESPHRNQGDGARGARGGVVAQPSAFLLAEPGPDAAGLAQRASGALQTLRRSAALGADRQT
jgi:hypothetical protein